MKKLKKYVKPIALALFFAVALCVLIPFVTTPYEKDYLVEVDYADKMIALTFDDGPGDYTMDLLDGLKENDITVSFFLLGRKIAGNESVVERMQQDGHLIGNHTYTHCTLFNTSVSGYKAELLKTDEEIFRVTGEHAEFFRPPHGHYTGSRLSRIDKMAVLWSNDPADWKHEDADYVYDYLMNHAGDGKIFLLHDTRKTTVDGVLRAVKELKDQGYTFVRADELLCRNGASLASGLAYRSCKNGKSPLYF